MCGLLNRLSSLNFFFNHLKLYKQFKQDPICHMTRTYGFITPADSSSTSLGIGLSIALKAERGIPDWLWGAVAQWSEHLQLKQEALGSIPSGCPGFFLFQLAYTNVNGMKDLWCSSTVRLLSTQI